MGHKAAHVSGWKKAIAGVVVLSFFIITPIWLAMAGKITVISIILAIVLFVDLVVGSLIPYEWYDLPYEGK